MRKLIRCSAAILPPAAPLISDERVSTRHQYPFGKLAGATRGECCRLAQEPGQGCVGAGVAVFHRPISTLSLDTRQVPDWCGFRGRATTYPLCNGASSTSPRCSALRALASTRIDQRRGSGGEYAEDGKLPIFEND